jgi:regulator of PEP synthase PpsR (kinase-PPPase family)
MKTKGVQEILVSRVAILSDGTGETAESFVRAVMAQFKKEDSKLIRIPSIKSEIELQQALDRFEPPYLIAYTFASEKLRKSAWGVIRERQLIGIDLLYPAIEIFSDFLKINPSGKTGALHSTQALGYFERVEAIEFTVKHDDGMRLQDLHTADIILVGVSRSSKTPTSIYLAHKGYRVANVPLVPGIDPAIEIFEAQKLGVPVICLNICFSDLERIRKSRVSNLGKFHENEYTDALRIKDELEASQKIARRHRWPIIDVTDKAIEETASEILLLIQRDSR